MNSIPRDRLAAYCERCDQFTPIQIIVGKYACEKCLSDVDQFVEYDENSRPIRFIPPIPNEVIAEMKKSMNENLEKK